MVETVSNAQMNRISEPLWVGLLQRMKVKDIVDPNRSLVRAQYNDYVSDLLKKLSQAQVLSAVVTEPNGTVWGFVDVLDLMIFVAEYCTHDNLSASTLKWEGQCFSRQMTGFVSNISQADPYFAVTYETSLWDCVKQFAEEIHRLAVVDQVTGRVVNVISQSDIVRVVAERGPFLGTKMMSPIHGEPGVAPVGVACVAEDMSVKETLKYMNNTKVSGVAVVNKLGHIVANFSATDLLGLTEENFSILLLPVKEYLNKVYGFPRDPIVCTPYETVETVIYKLVIHKVHRIYVVNDQMKPTGVISLTDIMRFLLSGEQFTA